MSRCLTHKLLPEGEIRLTNRELAVLRWTGDGKTSSEISEIMGISDSTVNFHIRNAVAKLGTANKLGGYGQGSNAGVALLVDCTDHEAIGGGVVIPETVFTCDSESG